jgi:hypothetical protein
VAETASLLSSRLTERVAALLPRVQYLRVEQPILRRAVSHLRYRCYLREKAIAPRPDQKLSDDFDQNHNTFTFAIVLDDELVGSIRLHVLTAIHPESPTMQAFGEVLRPLVQNGHTLIDPTRFVVDQNAARRVPELAYLTLRLPVIAARHFSAQFILAAVREEHMPFYQRVLRCKKVADSREYLQLTKPLGLMMVSYPNEHEAVTRRYPFFAPSSGEGIRLFTGGLPETGMSRALA